MARRLGMQTEEPAQEEEQVQQQLPVQEAAEESQIPEQEIQAEQPQEEPPTQEPRQGPRLIAKPPEAPQEQEKEPTYWETFKKGFNRSASGATAQLFGAAINEQEDKPQGFWKSVIQESGTLIGDTPFMGIGASMGAAMSGGNPIVAAATVPFSAMAMPAFLKEASRQYRSFQDEGGDLSFGEFLERADQVADKTLNEGLFGVMLGAIKKSVPLLEKIPGVKQLFNTRYIGGLAREATTIGAETAAATGIPAAIEGRLPTQEEVARAGVLFAGGRATELPGQLMDVIKESKSEKFNYALADNIEKLDLAYPSIKEFKKGENPIYKNNAALDRNLTAFDESYVGNIVSKINSLSNTQFSSSHEAGLEMHRMLAPPVVLPGNPTISQPTTPPPVKPTKRIVHLTQNPLQQAVETISPQVAPSKAELGRRITREYEASRATDYQPLRERYQSIDEQSRGLTVVDQDIPERIGEFAERFEGSVIPGSSSQLVVSAARRMQRLFEQLDEEGNVSGYNDVPLRTIMATNKSIKEIPNWDVPPEMKQNLHQLTAFMDEAIAGHLSNYSTELGQEYTNLNRDYAMFKNRYDNRDMRIFYDRTENSEAVANRFTQLDEFTQLTQALEGSPNGDAVLNLVRREAWQNKLGREALSARTEGDFEAATSKFTDREFNDLMEYLTPQQRQIAVNAMDHSNQIRESAIRSEAQFSADREQYAREKQEWQRQEKEQRKNQTSKVVQTKQDLLVSLLKNDPATFVGNMKTIEGIQRVKEASKNVAGGKGLYDSLARFETENMFSFMKEGYLKSGRVPYSEMKIQMQNREFRSKLKELNGEKFVQHMDELVSTADHLSDNFKEMKVKFKDDEVAMNNILKVYSLLGLVQGDVFTPLMAYTAKKNLLKIGGKVQNMWSDKRAYDPVFIQKTLSAARAASKGNKAELKRQVDLLAPAQPPLRMNRQ